MSGSKELLKGLGGNKKRITYGNNNRNNDGNNSKIVISKKKEEDKPKLKRVSFYLKEDNIDKIDQYHQEAGMGKSEFINHVLEKVFNELEIK